MESKVFTNVSEEHFNKLKSKLKELGINLEDTEGTVSGMFGVKLKYQYLYNNLTVDILEKPFLIGYKQIFSQIENAMK
jgi:hypothetical protein